MTSSLKSDNGNVVRKKLFKVLFRFCCNAHYLEKLIMDWSGNLLSHFIPAFITPRYFFLSFRLNFTVWKSLPMFVEIPVQPISWTIWQFIFSTPRTSVLIDVISLVSGKSGWLHNQSISFFYVIIVTTIPPTSHATQNCKEQHFKTFQLRRKYCTGISFLKFIWFRWSMSKIAKAMQRPHQVLQI